MSHGKKSRAKNRERRLREKRSRKAAERSKYESFRDKGVNTKSKRSRTKKKYLVSSKIDHPQGRCGNPACKKCFGVCYHPFLDKKGVPRGMPHWMYLRWKADHGVS